GGRGQVAWPERGGHCARSAQRCGGTCRAAGRLRRHLMIAEKLGQSRSTFFNRAWLWAAAGMILFGMILRERSLSLLGFVPLITAGGAWLWARYSLDRVEYTRELSTDRAFSGDQVSMRVSVVNRKLLPL